MVLRLALSQALYIMPRPSGARPNNPDTYNIIAESRGLRNGIANFPGRGCLQDAVSVLSQHPFPLLFWHPLPSAATSKSCMLMWLRCGFGRKRMPDNKAETDAGIVLMPTTTTTEPNRGQGKIKVKVR